MNEYSSTDTRLTGLRLVCFVLLLMVGAFLIAACDSSSDGQDEEEDEDEGETSEFEGTWISTDDDHTLKLVIDEAGVLDVYVADAPSTYDYAGQSTITYDKMRHRFVMVKTAKGDDSNTVTATGGLSADGDTMVMFVYFEVGPLVVMHGGDPDTLVGTWTAYYVGSPGGTPVSWDATYTINEDRTTFAYHVVLDGTTYEDTADLAIDEAGKKMALTTAPDTPAFRAGTAFYDVVGEYLIIGPTDAGGDPTISPKRVIMERQ